MLPSTCGILCSALTTSGRTLTTALFPTRSRTKGVDCRPTTALLEKNMLVRTLMVAAGFAALLAAGGCSTLTDYGSGRQEGPKNDQGHRIRYNRKLRHQQK